MLGIKRNRNKTFKQRVGLVVMCGVRGADSLVTVCSLGYFSVEWFRTYMCSDLAEYLED